MVPPRKGFVSNVDLTTVRNDVRLPCGITKRCICAFASGIYAMERRNQASPMV